MQKWIQESDTQGNMIKQTRNDISDFIKKIQNDNVATRDYSMAIKTEFYQKISNEQHRIDLLQRVEPKFDALNKMISQNLQQMDFEHRKLAQDNIFKLKNLEISMETQANEMDSNTKVLTRDIKFVKQALLHWEDSQKKYQKQLDKKMDE